MSAKNVIKTAIKDHVLQHSPAVVFCVKVIICFLNFAFNCVD